MSRLPREFQRLFHTEAGAPGTVRALVLEVARPAQWPILSAVWQGVQAELDLPAPAIAVNGVDGLQLWFPLQQPVDAAAGHAFLDALRQRYLADLPRSRVRLLTVGSASEAGAASDPQVEPLQVPAVQADTGNWSAFVAPDLAPIFDEAPWLDIPPGEDGQADLLARLRSITPVAFEAAWQRLQPQAEALAVAPLMSHTASLSTPSQSPAQPGVHASAKAAARQFLLHVMNDTSAPLAQRIEAAKALLQSPAAD